MGTGISGLAIDASGNVYVTGITDATDFPTVNAFQASFPNPGPGNFNAFVTKLNSSGTALVYSTYLGNGETQAVGIAVDASGDAYITGSVATGVAGFSGFVQPPPPFPTTAGAFQSTAPSANVSAFVTELDPVGSGLVYSTYLGGSQASFGIGSNFHQAGFGIAVDSSGEACVTGVTSATDFPTTPGAYQTQNAGANEPNAFVTKLSADGSMPIFSTYLGGNGYAEGDGIAVDSSGDAYVAGITGYADPTAGSFPITQGAFQTTFGGGFTDGYVSKLSPDGTTLVYSTYLGGSNELLGAGQTIAVDSSDDVFVTGLTGPNLPLANPIQASLAGSQNAFVTEVNAAGTASPFSTYLGGNGSDSGFGVGLDSSGDVYVAGYTNSTNFPTVNAYQAVDAGGYDAFVSKIVFNTSTMTTVTSSANSSVYGQSVTFTATVGAASGTPTGSVDFFDVTTNTDLGSVALSGGIASLTTSSLAIGNHVIQVGYSGDAIFTPSTGSLAQPVTVFDPFLVVNTNDSGPGSLRQAILDANAEAALGVSETITFDPSLDGQTIGLTQGQLEITAGSGTVMINGGGQIAVSGNYASRVLLVDRGGNLSLTGLTIEEWQCWRRERRRYR
jgi:hypothetical protein